MPAEVSDGPIRLTHQYEQLQDRQERLLGILGFLERDRGKRSLVDRNQRHITYLGFCNAMVEKTENDVDRFQVLSIMLVIAVFILGYCWRKKFFEAGFGHVGQKINDVARVV